MLCPRHNAFDDAWIQLLSGVSLLVQDEIVDIRTLLKVCLNSCSVIIPVANFSSSFTILSRDRGHLLTLFLDQFLEEVLNLGAVVSWEVLLICLEGWYRVRGFLYGFVPALIIPAHILTAGGRRALVTFRLTHRDCHIICAVILREMEILLRRGIIWLKVTGCAESCTLNMRNVSLSM